MKIMKKMTFAVWFTALLAVFTFSSCLNSDDNDGQRFGTEAVKVVGSLGTYEFQTLNGFTLIPTNMSELTMDLSTRFAMIAYTFNPEQVNQTTKRVPVVMKAILPIRSQYTNPSLNAMEKFANAPIRNITTEASYEFFSVAFWDAKTMFLPITFFVRDLPEKEMEAEYKKHSFMVCYDINNEENDKNTLVFHVRHNVADPDMNKERKYRYTSNVYELDLNMALNEFQTKFGGTPRTIKLEYEENYTGEYDHDNIKSHISEVDYEKYLQNMKK